MTRILLRLLLLVVLVVLAPFTLPPQRADATCTPLGTTTPNLALCKPAVGETNWGTALNGNWDIVDGLTSGTAIGGPGSRNLVGQNDAGTPNSKWGFSADALILRNPTTGVLTVRTSVTTVTCNLGVTGANGLDTGTQASSTWYYFYGIWNGSTTACLASITPPPTGPALPTGYTSWTYAAAVFSDGATHLIKTRQRAMRGYFEAAQNSVTDRQDVTEQTISLSSLVPPGALDVQLHARCVVTASSIATDVCKLRYVTSSDFFTLNNASNQPGSGNGAVITIPNLSQQYFFIVVTTGTAPKLTVDVGGYSIPNGGS